MTRNNARILFFDIEAGNLSGDFGEVICISWKFLGDPKIHTLSVTQSPDYKKHPYSFSDKWVVDKFGKVYETADIAVAHYGSKFDVPFINTRRLLHGLSPLSPVPFIDTWRVAKTRLKLHSNRLASIVDFFHLPQKTPLDGSIWTRAIRGDKKAIRYVVEHCEADIIALEAAYLKLRPLIDNHPHLSPNGCPNCGSGLVQSRGVNVTRVQKRTRYQCQSCGHWFLGKPLK